MMLIRSDRLADVLSEHVARVLCVPANTTPGGFAYGDLFALANDARVAAGDSLGAWAADTCGLSPNVLAQVRRRVGLLVLALEPHEADPLDGTRAWPAAVRFRALPG